VAVFTVEKVEAEEKDLVIAEGPGNNRVTTV
jgi:hypothetical protein